MSNYVIYRYFNKIGCPTYFIPPLGMFRLVSLPLPLL